MRVVWVLGFRMWNLNVNKDEVVKAECCVSHVDWYHKQLLRVGGIRSLILPAPDLLTPTNIWTTNKTRQNTLRIIQDTTWETHKLRQSISKKSASVKTLLEERETLFLSAFSFSNGFDGRGKKILINEMISKSCSYVPLTFILIAKFCLG